MDRTPGQHPCYPCPTCGRADASVIVPSRYGAYCECRTCGHRWLDAHPPPCGATPPELRRKSDRRKA
jgi:hypothetical protein